MTWTAIPRFPLNCFPAVTRSELIKPDPYLVHPMARDLEMNSDPLFTRFDTEEGETTGEVWFPPSLFLQATMGRFGRNFIVFIRALLKKSDEPVKGIELL
jgi:hypothetical protein